MYSLTDTIAAVSSPTSNQRVIIRIAGQQAINILKSLLKTTGKLKSNTVTKKTIVLTPQLELDAAVYSFFAPNSYTGDDLIEIHTFTNSSVTAELMQHLFYRGARPAQPGEFTARAYINGKMDLARAEAVCEIVNASNRFQLDAAQKLLAGRLGKHIQKISSMIMQCLTSIEAGIDFSNQDIEIISTEQAVKKISRIRNCLHKLINENIYCESILDLPSVGIAGIPNAGKSTLVNRLLRNQRSIVSGRPNTTRDVLTDTLDLPHGRCVLFDTAGILRSSRKILDRLTKNAAIEALNHASLIIFCVDISKSDFIEDLRAKSFIPVGKAIFAATKSDLLTPEQLDATLENLTSKFNADFTPISAKTGRNIDTLRKQIDEKLNHTNAETLQSNLPAQTSLQLTARHKNALEQALENTEHAITHLHAGNDEITATMLRIAHQALSAVENETANEKILKNIFSRFCIGK